MKYKYYHGVQEYVDEIYDKLYPREKAAVDAIKEKGFFVKFDLAKAGLRTDQGARAIKDLEERGIPIMHMTRARVPESKNPVARYTYGDPKEIKPEWRNGRRIVPAHLKQRLIRANGSRCAFCGRELSASQLQIDHKLPIKYFGIPTQAERNNLDNYQLLCNECNRQKTKAVDEGCAKTCYKTDDMKVIKSCYWYDHDNYTHVCMKPIRTIRLIWSEDEVKYYDCLKREAKKSGISLQSLMKKKLNS